MSKPTFVDVSPTKELFISMLVKDIPLSRSILDLVDNCVDGAKRLRPNGNYRDLHVKISFDANSFSVQDNCGGITFKDAEYAFRIGRPSDVKGLKHSVGQFGIGMKRALFKIGSQFKISTTTAHSHFVIEENVIKWKDKPGWRFDLKDVKTSTNLESEIGTEITVKKLYDNIVDEFNSDDFYNVLKLELEAAHCESIAKGLSIKLGDENLISKILYLKSSAKIKPAYRKHHIEPAPGINVRLYAGVEESKPAEAGWYIFCNGRMLIEADQTQVTGWGEEDEVKIPRYHNQFANFRGYVFFDSDITALLPWNTTKTGVNSDSQLYRATRQEMMSMMRPVIDFLNDLKEDKEGDPKASALWEFLEKAKSQKLEGIVERKSFLAPSGENIQPQNARILYSRPMRQFDTVRRRLKVKSEREVGEKTFDYYYKMECED